MPIITESDTAYHANPALGRSKLWKLLKKTPAHILAEETETKAQAIGTAAHLAILQPELLESRVLVGPDINKNTKEWKALKESAEATHRILLDFTAFDIIRQMRDNAHKHALVRRLVSEGAMIERSVYWEEGGDQFKARPDVDNVRLNLLGDIKTAVDASGRAFSRSVAAYGYHLQEFMYSRGMAANGRPVDGFVFIVVEKEAPYLVALYELDPHAIAEAGRQFDKAVASYRACAENDSWPGYTPVGPEIINLPAWAFTEDRYDAFEETA